MTKRSHSFRRPVGFVVAVALMVAPILGRAQTATQSAATMTPTAQIPGIPNRPDLVTVVPFYSKPNETDREKTKAVISAFIDGYQSVFIVDIGAPPLMLNRTYLQPSATGGIDTATDANRIPDKTTTAISSFDRVHVKTVRIGTFDITVDNDPEIGPSANAYLGHMWGNFSWVFSPRLGNIGLSVLGQFETIVDYTNRRLVLIKVDSAGHRLIDVPAYTPRWTAPMIDIAHWHNSWRAWGIAVRPDFVLDTLDQTKNTKTMMMDTGMPDNSPQMLGYPFLSAFGVVGFNHRAHQFILYK